MTEIASVSRVSAARSTGSTGSTWVLRRLPLFGLVAFVAVLGYLVVLPLVRVQMLSFQDHAAGYSAVFGSSSFVGVLGTTIALALGSVVIAMVLGTWLAWAASRLPVRWKFLQIVPVLAIIVPAVACVSGWAFLFSPRPGFLNAALRKLPWWSHLNSGPVDIYSALWIIIITGFSLTSFVYLFVSTGLRNINQEHIDAARAAGSSSVAVFFKVILPLLRPSLIYGGGVALLLGLGQFTAPLLLGINSGTRVLTTEMYNYLSAYPVDFGAAAAIGSPLLVFGIIVVLLQRVGLGDQTRFVTHGGKSFRNSGAPSRMAVVGIVVYGLISTVLPLLALCVVALSPYWSGSIHPTAFTLNNVKAVLSRPDISSAVITSVSAAALAVLIVLPISFLAASVLLRGTKYRVLRLVLDFIIGLPLGVPAVIFGAGFLFTYTSKPLVFYGSPWLMVILYVALMLPFGTRMLLSSMMSQGNAYREASRVSGAGIIKTDLKVVLPLLRSSAGGAAALIFILLTHEFSASLLVRTPTTNVMGTILYDYWTNGAYTTVAAIALVMTVVTGIGVALAMLLGGRDVFDRL